MSSEIKKEINDALQLNCNLHQLKAQIKSKYGHSFELKIFRNLKEQLKKDPKSRNKLSEFVEILRTKYSNYLDIFSDGASQH